MESRTILYTFAATAVLAGVIASCAAPKKIDTIRTQQMRANLALPAERAAEFRKFETQSAPKDTIVIKDDDGKDLIVMKTVVVDGEVMAGETLEAAVVTARFRNIAERHGKIDLEFDVLVPKMMMDSKWQLRFNPDMYILGDSLRLDPVIITGKEYRKAQLKGYQQYEKFLSSIVSDTTRFINLGQLEIFLERNIPQLYAFKNDTTEVSDEMFLSAYGVSERMAVEHYTNKFLKYRNDRRKARRGKMYRKYVKAPIVTEGIRLDTIIQEINGDFRYRYIQTVETRPKLRKIDVVLSGDILEAGKPVYMIPRCEPLTFYVSSVATLVSNEERYLTKVIERKAEANTACYIEFAVGKSDIDEKLGNNRKEIGRIKGNLRDILNNEKFDLDSISITAYASPEGSVSANGKLSAKRAESASKFFSKYLSQVQDSLRKEAGMTLVIGDDGTDSGMKSAYRKMDIKFLSHNGGENWKMLDWLVDSDTLFNNAMKEEYFSFREKFKDPDAREGAFKGKPYYTDMRRRLYPYCRVVAFDFHMHRKGMIKDTIHTTVLDSVYMAGVQAIRDRDYEAAISMLHSYQDYNCAVAYIALDRNQSAMRILEKLPSTPNIDYLMAILYSRDGDDQNAVQKYMDACRKDRSFVNRGNLDPEIAVLIKRYGLNKQDDDEFKDLLPF